MAEKMIREQIEYLQHIFKFPFVAGFNRLPDYNLPIQPGEAQIPVVPMKPGFSKLELKTEG